MQRIAQRFLHTRLLFYFCLFIVFCSNLEAVTHLESRPQEFILSTKKISIPGYPHAFNPSIVRWNGSLLMYFRSISPHAFPHRSDLGFVWLDEKFNIRGKAHLLAQTENFESLDIISTRAEDIRLVTVGEKLYMAYNDYRHAFLPAFGRIRMHVAEVRYDGEKFTAHEIERLQAFDGENPRLREKNWTPFNYQGNLLLIYSLVPHLIFKPLFGEGACETLASTMTKIDWEWGELRGGTPALQIDEERYLSFFHSCIKMRSEVSKKMKLKHYFMGAYTFSSAPPFEILQASPEPIIGKKFYSGTRYRSYWTPVIALFPSGFVFDENYIWISYGRQDHEAWIVKLDKQKFLDSLAPVGGFE